jgi:FkbM family methyltransferase
VIEVEYDGIRCLFSDGGINPDAPGTIAAPLLQGRFYEAKFLDYIAKQALRGTYVDVGANIGTHTLFFALMCPSEHVYSFEPRTRFLAILDTNVGLNHARDKVTTSGFALSDQDGEVTATLDGSDHVLVTRRLDDLVDRPIALIKVDVEGMEPRVLDGAARILRQDAPVVYAEALSDGDFAALRDTLARHRYQPTGRRFNASPTYEFVPDAARRSSLGWTGPVPVQPPAPPTAQRPVTARRPWPVRARMWVRRQPVVRRMARWRNSLRGR